MVKYSAVSRQADRTAAPDHPENLPEDYLTQARSGRGDYDQVGSGVGRAVRSP